MFDLWVLTLNMLHVSCLTSGGKLIHERIPCKFINLLYGSKVMPITVKANVRRGTYASVTEEPNRRISFL